MKNPILNRLLLLKIIPLVTKRNVTNRSVMMNNYPSTVSLNSSVCTGVNTSTQSQMNQNKFSSASSPSTYTSPSSSFLETDDIYRDNLAEVIPDKIWKQRIQDMGVTKDKLINKNYRGTLIPAIGPKEHATYYPDLSAITIDMMKHFLSKSRLGKDGRDYQKTRQM